MAVTFASIAGGPFGFEESVGAGGPINTVIGLIIIPFIWSIPQALMTAELSTMIPKNGGHILWVDRAFGTFWSFMNSIMTLVGRFFESGLYPVLYIDYFSRLIDVEFTFMQRFFIGLLMLVVVVLMNLRGTDLMSKFSVLFTIAGLGPFLLIILFGWFRISPSAIFANTANQFSPQPSIVPRNAKGILSPTSTMSTSTQPAGTIQWGLFFTIMLWNLGSYDTMGALAGEVDRPLDFPVALAVSMVLTTSVDMMMVLIGSSLDGNYTKWEDGTFLKIAEMVGGKYLGIIFLTGATISALGHACTLVMAAARMVYGMAKVGTLPRIFEQTTPDGTPWAATLLIAGVCCLTINLPFTVLAQGEMWFYAVTTVLKFLSVPMLRYKEPKSHRPFRIPFSGTALWVVMGIPIGLCFLVLYFAPWQTHLFGLISVAVTVGFYHALRAKILRNHSLHHGKGSELNFIDCDVLAED